ncbi:hypothetical protein [Anoxybacteroides tepidamans]|uniref:hypothetical protein n=1 Tax=Anoxybacteroides tepidamans TaxID=265948 RepID=UPI000688A2EF|nr:hypothetical protein [Anoxybacillus tepidamans]
MAYTISFFYAVSFVFLCLAIAAFLSLYKAKMYPPKKVLKNKMMLYILGAFLFFLIAWLLHYFR